MADNKLQNPPVAPAAKTVGGMHGRPQPQAKAMQSYEPRRPVPQSTEKRGW